MNSRKPCAVASVGALPGASGVVGALFYVNESGGAVLAMGDEIRRRSVTEGAVVS